MQLGLEPEALGKKLVLLAPWVKRFGGDLRIFDPHRGEKWIDRSMSEERSVVMRCPSMETESLPAETVARLCSLGIAFLMRFRPPRQKASKAPLKLSSRAPRSLENSVSVR
jgi:hypothetical protein